MTPQAGTGSDWFAGVVAGLDRLIHPGATGDRRAAQRRLFGVLLAGPFVASAAVAQVAWPFWGTAGVLAMLCGLFGASWLVALLAAGRVHGHAARILALAVGASLAGALAVLSGGMASPLAALLAVLPFEAWWIDRSRRAALVAGMVAVAVALGVALLPPLAAAPQISAWLWIAPALYGATLALRLGAAAPVAAAPEAVLPESGFDAVVVRLSRAGEAESVSSQARRIFGLEPELLLGNGLFERIHVADRVSFLCAASRARDEGRPAACEARIRMPARDGREAGFYHPFEVEMVPAAAGAVAALVRDGRARAELREALAQAAGEVESAEVAKGRFLATVSHELRTPLNAIIGFSDMLLHPAISGTLTAKQGEHVGLIRDAGNHLLSVVNAILDVSKIEAGSYPIAIEPFELEEAVELCCSMLEPQACERGVTLAASLPHGLSRVVGDRRAVQQILINLVSNAVKFTPSGGQVGVSASAGEGMVRIFVHDTGIGIADEDLGRLGRPFVQVQNDYTRQFQGTGLGLSLVKGLVKLHGGTMSIESAPGLGTTVTVALPAEGPGLAPARDETGNTGEERYGTALRKIA